MTKHTWSNRSLNSCLGSITFQNLPKALTAHALAIHVDEQGRLRLVGDDPGPDVPYVVLKGLHRTVVQGDDALLAPAAFIAFCA